MPLRAALGVEALAVLWDLDGTLLESNLSIRQTMNHVLGERGLPAFTKAELDALIGHPLRDILATKTTDRAAVEAMALRYRDVYSESGWVTVSLHAGVLELVEHLRRRGHPQAIVTSKGQQESEILLEDLGIAHLFDAVVGDDDARPLKPDPAPVLEACRLLRRAPADATMVGDTRFDVGAGKAAGVYAIGVLWGNGSAQSLVEAGADALVRDAADLQRVLARLGGT
ncbi:MAG: phosphoglycolate phosphatase [Thermoplasmata archaeon]|jgi:2-phosphoglycolate phosphatase|nr:phosphoglycolate phosphatase [Thermoplasmata archaeon]